MKSGILYFLQIEGFADDKINVTQKLKFILVKVQNIVEKGENAVFSEYQHFLLYPQCF